jgi:hypothetical protein
MSYQPIVIKKTNEILDILEESNFFIDFELDSNEFAKTYLADKLTIKFIEGNIDFEMDELFTEDEFDQMLKEIAAGTVLYELKEKGLVDSYSDDNTEEMFFLTEEGKKLLGDKD